MNQSVLEDAFGHHSWATLRLLEACRPLTAEQLETAVPGTFGSIIETLRHLVGADCSYLFTLSSGTRPAVDETGMDIGAMVATMEANRDAWNALVEHDIDSRTIVVRHREDGSESHAPAGIRLSQALHHGTDHRSQVCTALTAIGMEPPAIDVWDYAWQDGRLVEVPPPEMTT